jgi:glycosyltransferase involved in cell wall biosynthesis
MQTFGTASSAPRLPRLRLDRGTLAGTAAAIVVTVAVSAASAGSLLLALLIFGAVYLCAWLLLSERYELTLAVLLLYLGLLDGYVKLKLNTSWATLGRDALLYAIVAGALARAAIRRQRIEVPPLTGWVLAFSAVVLIQIFNPANGSWAHSIASVRPHLEFVPLFFLGYWTMRSKQRLRGFLLILLFAAAANGVFGLIQFNLSAEQFASWGPGYDKLIYGTNTLSGRAFPDANGVLHTRPFGLGSDAGFGGIIGMLAVPAALALVLARARARPVVLTVVLALGLGAAIGVVTSQARVAVISAVLAALIFGVLASVSRRVIGTFVALAIAFAVVLATVSIVTSNSKSEFRKYKTITPDRVIKTTYDYRSDTLALVPKYAWRFPLGAGIGGAGPAGGYGGPARGEALNAESEPTYLLIELGIPGLILLTAFNIKLFALALRRTHRLVDPELRLYLAALFAPLFAIFATWIAGIATATTPTAPYFWFVAGIAAYWLAGPGRQDRPALAAQPVPTAEPPPRERQRPRQPRRTATPLPYPGPLSSGSPPRVREHRPHAPAVPVPPSTGMAIDLVYRDRGAPVDGVRDYSRELNDALAANDADASLVLISGKRLPRKLAHADAVVVEYSPFAYGRWGFAPWLPRGLRQLRRDTPRPIVAVMVHEPFMPLSGLRAAVMGAWQRLQLRAVRRAADVTFVSIEPWVGKVRHWGPKGPIHHVPVGSSLPDMRHDGDLARAELGIDERAVVLAAFSTGHPSHLTGHVAASAIGLHEAGHSVVVLNLGAGAAPLKGLPESIRVETPGRLEPAAVARLLAAADLFVAPFVDGVSTRRTSFMAALQHALPVVATDGKLTDDLLHREHDAFRLAPVKDQRRFAAAVVDLAGQPAERERLAHEARGLYERRFAWSVIAAQVERHLHDVFLDHLRRPTRK